MARPIPFVTSHLNAIPTVTPTITDLLPHLSRLLRTQEHGELGNGSYWVRPPSCPPLDGFPYYEVAQLDTAIYALRGIHLRYHSWSDRAFLNLPLNGSTLAGTPYTVGQTLTVMLHLSEAHTVIDTGSHNLQRVSHSSGRCNIVLNELATERLKHERNLDRTRLIDNPSLLVILRPGTAFHEPPNLWKPLKLTDIYVKHGLLEVTIRYLGYDSIIHADIAFHGSGSQRPDGIITVSKSLCNGTKTRYEIIIEGKACSERMAARYVREGTIQALYHKIADQAHMNADEAIVCIPCDVNKMPWSSVVEVVRNCDKINYSHHIRKMAQNLRRTDGLSRMQSWYESHFHLHAINALETLADQRPLADRNAIAELLNRIRWT